MRRPSLLRVLAALLAALTLLLFATPTHVTLAATTAAEVAAGDEVEDYAGHWEYRWGDSPRDASGALAWARPGDNAVWRPLAAMGSPPDRNGQRYLWVRTRLTGRVVHDPTLYLRGVDQLVEAYLDGALIYRFGDFEGPEALRFKGYKAHYLPLGASYQGKTLALRIYSDHVNIGISGQPKIGPHADLTVVVIQRDLPTLGMGVILLSLGAFVLSLFASQRKDRGYLAYGLFAVAIGMYFVGVSPSRQLVADTPLAWVYLELFFLYVMPIFLSTYFEYVFGRGRLPLVRWMRWGFIAYAAGAVVVVAAGLVPVLRTLLPFQVLLLAWGVVTTVHAIRESVRGSLDARIFTTGFVIGVSTGSYDVLGAMGVLSRSNLPIGHVGIFAFTLAMGIILGRRFVEVHDRLGKYTTVLQLSLASARVLEQGQQARVALDELIKLLGARRALLFLTGEASGELSLRAAREALPGAPGATGATDLTHSTTAIALRHDVVDQVRALRRPLIARNVQLARGSRSAMAAPLLIRDELLGVVYLEADASRRPFGEADLAILLGLGTQLSITIVTTRAMRLELQSAQQESRLLQQGALLEAAARMARGDIETPIVVSEGRELYDLGRALESMRRDVKAKIEMLETKNAEVQVLNDELRRKIEERTVRLLAALLEDGVDKRPPKFKKGEFIDERYCVVRELGQGAMGVVYEVERKADKKRFATKVLSGQSDKVAMARFIREAQMLAKLDHRHLIGIADVDVTSAGLLYLVMELFAGHTLARFQEHFGEVRWALSALVQIAEGLAAVHASGVVHRDLKPANVLVALGRDGLPRLKLADFGISTLAGDQVPLPPKHYAGAYVDDEAPTTELVRTPSGRVDLTRTGILLGTPSYMGPELARPMRNPQPSADIFSFGIIAYELLTGDRPFPVPPIFLAVQGEALLHPNGLRDVHSLDLRLASLFERCMEEDPGARPTAREITATLMGMGIKLPED